MSTDYKALDFEAFGAEIEGKDIFSCANALASRYNANEMDTLRMLEEETDGQINESRAQHRGRTRVSYRDATTHAAVTLASWLERNGENAVTLDWASLAQSIAGHRRAYVWATCVAKARQAEERRQQKEHAEDCAYKIAYRRNVIAPCTCGFDGLE